MTAVIAVKHPDPIFLKDRPRQNLPAQMLPKAVFTVTGDQLQLYFDRNVEVLKGFGCAEKSKDPQGRRKAKTNMLTKSKFSFDSNGKLANCESRDKCEIFIVEETKNSQKPSIISGHPSHPWKNLKRRKSIYG